VITGDIPADVTALRQQPGNDITTGASGTLARCLPWERRAPSACPVLTSTGKRLFERGGRQVPLSLAEPRALRNGIIALRCTAAGQGDCGLSALTARTAAVVLTAFRKSARERGRFTTPFPPAARCPLYVREPRNTQSRDIRIA
jgi:hypothetical protein